VGIWETGPEFDGATICGDRLIELAGFPQCNGQIVVSLREVGFDLEGAAKRGDGFVEPTAFPEGMTQIAKRFQIVGFELEGAAECGDGLVEIASIPERVAQVEVSIRKVGHDLDRAAARVHGFIEPADRAASFAEVGMCDGIVRIEGDGLAHQIHREAMAPGAVRDETEEVQRAGVVGLRRKDLAVQRLGFGQTSRPVMLDCQIEGLWDRHG